MPTISGYQIETVLSQRASAQLFLGRQTSNQRRVVIKMGSANAHAAEKLFHQTNVIHANLQQILDLGESADGQYCVTSYLTAGDLAAQLNRGIHIQLLIKVVKDIARALQAMHEAGLVHCDVKPENILFAADNSCILGDMGNCRKIGHSCKGPNGLVIGTAQYMSPEQAAGRDVDGRADFYSLGVLLYHALTGELPYNANSPVELGIKHLQDPIPRLPGYLRSFQTLIDRVMAKRRDQRLDNADELVALIDVARSELKDVEASIKTQDISTHEILVAGGEMLATPRDPARAERHNQRRRRKRVARIGFSAGVVLIAASAVAYYALQTGVISPELVLSKLGLGEDPQLQAAWGEAQSLRSDPNQGLATIAAAYRRVLVLEPGHPGASLAIDNLTSEWVQEIDKALLAGSLEVATTRLREATAVFPEANEWLELATRLQNRQRAELIVTSTQTLLASHGLSDLPSATAAIQSYQEVLRLAPGHQQAQQALAELAVHYSTLATQAASEGRVNDAISLLERASASDATLSILDDVRILISQAATAQQAIEELVQQARRYRADDRLISPPGENAAELYRRVLAADTNNVIAIQGLDEVRAQISANMGALLTTGTLSGVEQLLTQASAAGMEAEFVNELRGRLDAETQRQNSVAQNLAQAEQLMKIGLLTAPANNNAVAKLRLVQQLEPGNAAAQQHLQNIAKRLVAVAQEAYDWGLRDEAKQYLDLALTINPEVTQWVTLRDSWQVD